VSNVTKYAFTGLVGVALITLVFMPFLDPVGRRGLVIAALIGAKGLGFDVLVALQYAAKGQGVLAGLAILFCAMVIDRIVQGSFRKSQDAKARGMVS